MLSLIVVEPITDNFNIASTIVVTNTIWYNPDHKLYYKNNDDSEQWVQGVISYQTDYTNDIISYGSDAFDTTLNVEKSTLAGATQYPVTFSMLKTGWGIFGKEGNKNYLNQNQDYQFTIKLSEYARYVDRIAAKIQIPGLQFQSPDCMQSNDQSATNVKIKKCWIQTQSSWDYGIVWIHLYHNSTQLYEDANGDLNQYSDLQGTYERYNDNQMTVQVRTVGNSVKNPATQPATQQYSLYFYAWEDQYDIGDNTVIDIENDTEFLFFRSKGTDFTIGLTFDAQAIQPQSMEMVQERYIDDFTNWNENLYAPVIFDIYVPQTFSKSSSNKKSIVVQLPSQIELISYTYQSEVQINRLICHVSGLITKRLQKECEISNLSKNEITIWYEEVVVPKSILHIEITKQNPFNFPNKHDLNTKAHQVGNGLKWTDTNKSLGHIYVTMEQDDSKKFEFTSPCQRFYMETDTIDYINIIDTFRSEIVGTQTAKFQTNFLQLYFHLHDTTYKTVTWLELEFFTKFDIQSSGKSKIFEDNKSLFGNLKSGDKYPCTYQAGYSMSPKNGDFIHCIYQKGDSTDDSPFGISHKVIVSNIQFTSASDDGMIQLLLRNPLEGLPLRIRLTAYGRDSGATSTEDLYEEVVLGDALIENAFDFGQSDDNNNDENFKNMYYNYAQSFNSDPATKAGAENAIKQVGSTFYPTNFLGSAVTLHITKSQHETNSKRPLVSLLKVPLQTIISYESNPQKYKMCTLNLSTNEYMIYENSLTINGEIYTEVYAYVIDICDNLNVSIDQANYRKQRECDSTVQQWFLNQLTCQSYYYENADGQYIWEKIDLYQDYTYSQYLTFDQASYAVGSQDPYIVINSAIDYVISRPFSDNFIVNDEYQFTQLTISDISVQGGSFSWANLNLVTNDAIMEINIIPGITNKGADQYFPVKCDMNYDTNQYKLSISNFNHIEGDIKILFSMINADVTNASRKYDMTIGVWTNKYSRYMSGSNSINTMNQYFYGQPVFFYIIENISSPTFIDEKYEGANPSENYIDCSYDQVNQKISCSLTIKPELVTVTGLSGNVQAVDGWGFTSTNNTFMILESQQDLRAIVEKGSGVLKANDYTTDVTFSEYDFKKGKTDYSGVSFTQWIRQSCSGPSCTDISYDNRNNIEFKGARSWRQEVKDGFTFNYDNYADQPTTQFTYNPQTIQHFYKDINNKKFTLNVENMKAASQMYRREESYSIQGYNNGCGCKTNTGCSGRIRGFSAHYDDDELYNRMFYNLYFDDTNYCCVYNSCWTSAPTNIEVPKKCCSYGRDEQPHYWRYFSDYCSVNYFCKDQINGNSQYDPGYTVYSFNSVPSLNQATDGLYDNYAYLFLNLIQTWEYKIEFQPVDLEYGQFWLQVQLKDESAVPYIASKQFNFLTGSQLVLQTFQYLNKKINEITELQVQINDIYMNENTYYQMIIEFPQRRDRQNLVHYIHNKAVNNDVMKEFLDENKLETFEISCNCQLTDVNIPLKCFSQRPYTTIADGKEYFPEAITVHSLRHTSLTGREKKNLLCYFPDMKVIDNLEVNFKLIEDVQALSFEGFQPWGYLDKSVNKWFYGAQQSTSTTFNIGSQYTQDTSTFTYGDDIIYEYSTIYNYNSANLNITLKKSKLNIGDLVYVNLMPGGPASNSLQNLCDGTILNNCRFYNSNQNNKYQSQVFIGEISALPPTDDYIYISGAVNNIFYYSDNGNMYDNFKTGSIDPQYVDVQIIRTSTSTAYVNQITARTLAEINVRDSPNYLGNNPLKIPNQIDLYSYNTMYVIYHKTLLRSTDTTQYVFEYDSTCSNYLLNDCAAFTYGSQVLSCVSKCINSKSYFIVQTVIGQLASSDEIIISIALQQPNQATKYIYARQFDVSIANGQEHISKRNYVINPDISRVSSNQEFFNQGYIKLYKFAPVMFLGDYYDATTYSIQQAPLRFKWTPQDASETSSADLFDFIFEINLENLQSSSVSPFLVFSAANLHNSNIQCFIREYRVSNYIQLNAPCRYDTTTSTISIKVPQSRRVDITNKYQMSFINDNNRHYEIIVDKIQSQAQRTGSGLSEVNYPYRSFFILKRTDFDVTTGADVLDPTPKEYYQGIHYLQENSYLTLQEFYLTSKVQNSYSHMYVVFKMEGNPANECIEHSGTKKEHFPHTVVNLIFEGLTFDENYSEWNLGEDINCGMTDFNTTGISVYPDVIVGDQIPSLALDYPGPRCIISKNSNQNLVIRVEWIESFPCDNEIKIAIDNIYIREKIYVQQTTEEPVSLKVQVLKGNYDDSTYDNYDMWLRQFNANNLFILQENLSKTTGTSIEMNQLVGTDRIQGKTGLTYSIDGTYPFNMYTNQINVGQSESKLLIQLMPEENGIMNVNWNSLLGYLPTYPALGFDDNGSNFNVIWYNQRSNIVVLRTPSDKTISQNFKINLKNVNNPKSSERDIYPTSPYINFKFFQNFGKKIHSQKVDLYSHFFPTDTDSKYYLPSFGNYFQLTNAEVDTKNEKFQLSSSSDQFTKVKMSLTITKNLNTGIQEDLDIIQQMDHLELIITDGLLVIDQCHRITVNGQAFNGICKVINQEIDESEDTNFFTNPSTATDRKLTIKIYRLRDLYRTMISEGVNTFTFNIFASILSDPTPNIKYRYKIYDYNGYLLCLSQDITSVPTPIQTETQNINGIDSNNVFQIKVAQFTQKRIFNWYQEMFETELYLDSTPEDLIFNIYVPEDLTSSTSTKDKIQVTFESSRKDYTLSNTGNGNYLLCQWHHEKNKYSEYGYGHLASSCSFSSNVLTITKPVESILQGYYQIKVRVNQDIGQPSYNFLWSNIASITPPDLPALSLTNILFQIYVNNIIEYKDVLYSAPKTEFNNDFSTLKHASATIDTYDLLIYTFQPSYSFSSADYKIGIDVLLRSEFYVYDNLEDLDLEELFNSEQRKTFINGENYPFVIYEWDSKVDHTYDSTYTGMFVSYGDWAQFEAPIKLTAYIDMDFVQGTTYQLRIPYLKNPSIAGKLRSTLVNLWVIENQSMEKINIQSYDFINYKYWTTDANITPKKFIDLVDDYPPNLAQQLKISFYFSFTDQIDLQKMTVDDWAYLKWDTQQLGVNPKNMRLLYESIAQTGWIIDFFEDLLLFALQRKTSPTPGLSGSAPIYYLSQGKIEFDVDDPNYVLSYVPAQYGFKAGQIMRDFETIHTLDDVNYSYLLTLGDPELLKYVRVTTLDPELTLFSEYSLLKFKIEFLTYQIPSDGYILIKIKPDQLIVSQQNELGWTCEPGKNIPKSNKQALECIKHSDYEFILRGFDEIPTNNDNSFIISKFREVYFIAQYKDLDNSNTYELALESITFYSSNNDFIGQFSQTDAVQPCPATCFDYQCQSLCYISSTNIYTIDKASTGLPFMMNKFNYEKKLFNTNYETDYTNGQILKSNYPLQFEFQLSNDLTNSIYTLEQDIQNDFLQIVLAFETLNGSPVEFSYNYVNDEEHYARYNIPDQYDYQIRALNDTITDTTKFLAAITDATANVDYDFISKNGTDFLTYRMTLQSIWDASDLNDYLWPSKFGFYRFWYFSHSDGSGTYDQEQFFDFELEVLPDNPNYEQATNEQIFKINPLHYVPGEETMLEVKIQVRQELSQGQEIWLEFETNNGIDNIFPYDLGTKSIYTSVNNQAPPDDYRELDCIELTDYIAVSGRIQCILYDGDAAKGLPAILKISVEKTITPNADVTNINEIHLVVAPFVNPSVGGDTTGLLQTRKMPVKLKFMEQCRDDIKMCSFMTTFDYYQVQQLASTVNQDFGTGEATFISEDPSTGASPSLIGAKNQKHIIQLDIPNSINKHVPANSYMLIKYPKYDAFNLPQLDRDKCIQPYTNDLDCIVFPNLYYVFVRLTSGLSNIAAAQQMIEYMNNGITETGGDNFKVYLWYPTYLNAKIYAYTILPPTFSIHKITDGIVFIPTQTYRPESLPNPYKYFFFDYTNYLNLTLPAGLFATEDVGYFIIDPPEQINSLDISYCNSTLLERDSEFYYHFPYPPRLDCEITSNDGVPFGSRNHEIRLTLNQYEMNKFYQKIQERNLLSSLQTELSNFRIRIYLKTKIESNDGFLNYDVGEWHARAYTIDNGFGSNLISELHPSDIKFNKFDEENILDWRFPLVNKVTFNTNTFADRKATIGDRTIQFYMMLLPLTKFTCTTKYTACTDRIDKMIFTLPTEFGYPAVKDLNGCDRYGVINYDSPVFDCNLARPYRDRYVTFYPDEISTGNNDAFYDHAINIITLGNTDQDYLFKAPKYPGTHYNMTLELYSEGILVEKSVVNLTNVQGYDFDISYMTIQNVADIDIKGLYQISFKVGNVDVPIGYNYGVSIYSNIILSFNIDDNNLIEDIGSGLNDGDEIGCVGVQGINISRQNRLICKIYLGSSEDYPPTIIVSGYDPIDAETQIIIYLTEIIPNVANTIGVGIKLYYNDFGTEAYLYGPQSLSPIKGTAVSGVISLLNPVLTISDIGKNKILDEINYTFSFKQNSNTYSFETDYFYLTFPESYFDSYSDYSNVKCYSIVNSGAKTECQNLIIFGISNTIYLKLKQNLSVNDVVKISIENLISPSYENNSLNQSILLQIFNSLNKQSAKASFQISQNTVSVCDSFQYFKSQSDNSLGGVNDATYTFDFITGHDVPYFGAITLTLPENYDSDFYSLGTKCTLKKFDAAAKCKIGAKNRIDVFMNGVKLDNDKEYSISISNMGNPMSTDNMNFLLTSYYSGDIYMQQKICEQVVPYPFISSMIVRSCEFYPEIDVNTVNLQSTYTFNFKCQTQVRDNSVVQIYIPKQYLKNNNLQRDLKCSSLQSNTLYSQDCYLLNDDNSDLLILEAYLREQNAQQLFSIQIEIFNPDISGQYSFYGYIFKDSIHYLSGIKKQSQVRYITIEQTTQDQESQEEQSSRNIIQLENLPNNAGELAFYIFSIPPVNDLVGTTSQLQINFPEVFSKNIGQNLECGVYPLPENQSFFKNYVETLKISQDEQYFPSNYSYNVPYTYQKASCSVQNQNSLLIKSLPFDEQTLNPQKLWFHVIIRNVFNPLIPSSSSINSQNQYSFKFYYLDANSNILWKTQQQLTYFISSTNDQFGIEEIRPSTYYLQSQADYSITVDSITPLNEYFTDTDIAILVRFPYEIYSDVELLQYYQNLVCSTNFGAIEEYWDDCGIYGMELLINNVKFTDSRYAYQFQINLENIINPAQSLDCTNDSQTFKVIFLDKISNQFLVSSDSLLNNQDCLKFQGSLFDIQIQGSKIVNPGFSFTYKVIIEEKADGLILTPTSEFNSYFTFEPSEIKFDDYYLDQIGLVISVKEGTPEQNITIYFQKTEQQGLFYKPVLPLQIEILQISAENANVPIIEIGNVNTETIGYPIFIPIIVSSPPSFLIYLTAELIGDDNYNAVTIENNRIPIDVKTTETYLSITVNSTRVPDMMQIEFSISSFYDLDYELDPPVKYLLFSISNNGYLKVLVQDKDNYDRVDVDKYLPAYQKTSIQEREDKLQPKFIQIKKASITSNSIHINIMTSKQCYIYYILQMAGDEIPSKSDILAQTIDSIQKGIVQTSVYFTEGKISTSQYYNQLKLNNLDSQTPYLLYAVAQNPLGYSEIESYQFTTNSPSFGCKVKIPVKQSVDSTLITDQVIEALRDTLRIPKNRFLQITTEKEVQEDIDEFNSDIMLSSQLYIEVMILPNSTNDSPTPFEYAEKLLTQTYYERLENILETLDTDRDIEVQEVQKNSPQVRIEPYTQKITYNSATVQIMFQEQSRVWAVCRRYKENNQPVYSKQIYLGRNETNSKQSQYWVSSTTVSANQYATLHFDDLLDNTEYEILITVSPVLLYDEPPHLYSSSDIQAIKFITPPNPNLNFNEISILKELKEINPELEEYLERIITRDQNQLSKTHSVQIFKSRPKLRQL
ncbi:hypothetical protein PPERSA_04125 [Pseudocohnilembus persalinus]|uniref:Uncharacterized protein n=1 Tax=Pseudocohnilembus persalinus TaxID=266149 RepID=A0A0V0QNP5_PSEPJ|nr:hypothetical protein PPERSA_04125 [Pseudocohnilembus persalinus]|eukprot:KRX03573.1 hypothetical protein PPERSA_04125 [Pseudocohnilembus persalinus]